MVSEGVGLVLNKPVAGLKVTFETVPTDPPLVANIENVSVPGSIVVNV